MNAKALFSILNDNNIEYCILNADTSYKNIDLLIHPDNCKEYMHLMESNEFKKSPLIDDGYSLIYGLIPSIQYTFDDLKINASYQLSCHSLSNLSKCILPLDKSIQNALWKNKEYNKEYGCYIIGNNERLVSIITKCIFNSGEFMPYDENQISEYFDKADLSILANELEQVFFKFTPMLMKMIASKDYGNIIKKYKTFSDY